MGQHPVGEGKDKFGLIPSLHGLMAYVNEVEPDGGHVTEAVVSLIEHVADYEELPTVITDWAGLP